MKDHVFTLGIEEEFQIIDPVLAQAQPKKGKLPAQGPRRRHIAIYGMPLMRRNAVVIKMIAIIY